MVAKPVLKSVSTEPSVVLILPSPSVSSRVHRSRCTTEECDVACSAPCDCGGEGGGSVVSACSVVVVTGLRRSRIVCSGEFGVGAVCGAARGTSGGPLPPCCAQAAGDNSTVANAMASTLRLLAFMAFLLFAFGMLTTACISAGAHARG